MAYQYHIWYLSSEIPPSHEIWDKWSFFHVSTSANIFPIAGVCHRWDMSKIPRRWVTWICLKSYGDFFRTIQASPKTGDLFGFSKIMSFTSKIVLLISYSTYLPRFQCLHPLIHVVVDPISMGSNPRTSVRLFRTLERLKHHLQG